MYGAVELKGRNRRGGDSRSVEDLRLAYDLEHFAIYLTRKGLNEAAIAARVARSRD